MKVRFQKGKKGKGKHAGLELQDTIVFVPETPHEAFRLGKVLGEKRQGQRCLCYSTGDGQVNGVEIRADQLLDWIDANGHH